MKGFDIIIGNPPYVQIKNISANRKADYTKLFKYSTGRFNLFYFFIEITQTLAAPGGITSYIIPDRLLLNTQCTDLRSHLLKNQSLLEIISFGEFVFSSAIVDSIIITYSNEVNKNDGIMSLQNCSSRDLQGRQRVRIPLTHVLDSPNKQLDLNYNPTNSLIISKIRNNTVLYGEVCDIKDGIIQSKIPDKLFLKEAFDGNSKKLLFGRDINKYKITWSNNWVNYNVDQMKSLETQRGGNGLRLRSKGIFERDKILTRQTSDCIIAAYDNSDYYYSNTIHGASVIDDRVSPLYLLGILNSKLINFYYQSITAEKGKVFAQIKIELLCLLPIKITNNQSEIIERVRKLMNQDEKGEILTIEKELNILVYSIYGLSFNEAQVIDPSIENDTFDKMKKLITANSC